MGSPVLVVIPIAAAAALVGGLVGNMATPDDGRKEHWLQVLLMLIPAAFALGCVIKFSQDILIFKILEAIFAPLITLCISLVISEIKFHKRFPNFGDQFNA